MVLIFCKLMMLQISAYTRMLEELFVIKETYFSRVASLGCIQNIYCKWSQCGMWNVLCYVHKRVTSKTCTSTTPLRNKHTHTHKKKKKRLRRDQLLPKPGFEAATTQSHLQSLNHQATPPPPPLINWLLTVNAQSTTKVILGQNTGHQITSKSHSHCSHITHDITLHWKRTEK